MKQLFICTFVFLIALSANGQDFYDLNIIQNIEITFTDSNWDQLLHDENAGADGYLMAESVIMNGEVFDSVGVKYKGNSTYDPRQDKNPFHIEFNTFKDQKYNGYSDVKLSNVAKDPSFLREVLSYQILRQYMDASLSNFANVTVNGTLIGLYSNSEAINKTFVDDRFGSKNHTFIKCNPIAGAGPNSSDLPSLEYLGQDSSSYFSAYELKSDDGWADLINLCNTLSNDADKIESVLDVDRALWMLAFNNVFVNLDSYIGQFTQNYYLYQDDNGRFLPIVWDLNESFGTFSGTGSGNLNSTAQKQQMDLFLHENDNGFPLVQSLLGNPTYKRMYTAHVKTMLQENFEDGSYEETGLALQTVIDAAVQADNFKFFTYDNFLSNLTADVGGGGGGPGGGGAATPGIVSLMEGRTSYLLGLPELSATQPTVTDIKLSIDEPIIDQPVTITATVTDATEVSLRFRYNKEAVFTKLQMLDDGNHNDGAAGDGVYGAEITVIDSKTHYYIYAENTEAGMFSPQRAEHEFYEIKATIEAPTLGDLVINELLASNAVTEADQDGEFDDWIELYNNGTTAIDLEGYTLSDDVNELDQWAFPAGTTIGANEYLIIWADKDDEQVGLHSSFKLSAGGETVFLSDAAGELLDQVELQDQIEDISYGRFPNGTGDFLTMPPTFNMENAEPSAVDELLSEQNISVFPNPTSDYFDIVVESSQSETLSFYDLKGHQVYTNQLNGKTRVETTDWEAGIYFLHVVDTVMKVVVVE